MKYCLYALGLFAVFLQVAVALAAQAEQGSAPANFLENRLLQENPAALAQAARQQGDPARGAILFFQPALACAKCHALGEKSIGPDLANPGSKLSGADIVDSVLRPSKLIRKGYEPVTIITKQGVALTGLLAEERGDRIILRDAGQDFKPISIPSSNVEERATLKVSLMPAGLVNQLATRQQFLDLACYLMEIAEKGPARERELRPDPALLAPPPLPEYEKSLDHAGIIGMLDIACYRRGEIIYNRLCINCHGTRERVGALPAALRFGSGRFKNGCDPYSIYQTLTRGFGMMTAQTWMVPQQKYDVIHYIREAYLKPFNRDQNVSVNAAYLAGLPTGKERGPAPSNLEPWAIMNYGPTMMATFEVGHDQSNFAYKGIAVRLDPGPGGISQGHAWMLYDHDTLRVAAAWSGSNFIDWNSVQFTGQHEVHPHIVGTVSFANPTGPGWANPQDQSFNEVRIRGRDGRPCGPLPRSWAHYRGLYHYGNQAAIAYTVGDTEVLEMPGLGKSATGTAPVFKRTFNLGPRRRELLLQVAHQPGRPQFRSMQGANSKDMTVAFGSQESPEHPALIAGIVHAPEQSTWQDCGGDLRLSIPAGKEPLRFTVWLTHVDRSPQIEPFVAGIQVEQPDLDLTALTHGGPARWSAKLVTQPKFGKDDGPFAVDVLNHPDNNPWYCRMRFSGLDFLPDGNRVAVCSWDGDVWLVEGIRSPERGLTWQRIASGLFQPLGLKIKDGKIYVSCRDQIVVLHDLNGDGEIDFYENFNNDHQVTEHFHEFVMGLQTDAAGNFYYCKGGRHALTAIVPHHGTLLRVSRDGSNTTIVANGFRAANGVCVNSDGTFFLTDQEGHWTPKNRINWVAEGGFYGYMWGYHNFVDASDRAMKQPICWITNDFDRSPAEVLRVESKAWGPLNGTLLNLSYGTGEIFIVPYETIHGTMQGGMCRLPMSLFPTGVMRGRFNPESGQLYTCGLFVWAGNQEQPGGFYRVRFTGKSAWLPIALHARARQIRITFSDPLDAPSVTDSQHYSVKIWGLRRSAEYGSKHYDERLLRVTAAHLTPDGRTVILEIPELAPTQCMEIKCFLKGTGGQPVDRVVHNTIHVLGP